jgi:hypothetical protein
MVAAAIHPTGECYGLANIFLAKLAAVMCTFHGCILEDNFSGENVEKSELVCHLQNDFLS